MSPPPLSRGERLYLKLSAWATIATMSYSLILWGHI